MEEDKSEYTKHYEKSKQGDSVSTLMISYFYQYGRYVKKDLFKAKKWLDKSIHMGNVLAKARKYYMGWDDKGNEKLALDLLGKKK